MVVDETGVDEPGIYDKLAFMTSWPCAQLVINVEHMQQISKR